MTSAKNSKQERHIEKVASQFENYNARTCSKLLHRQNYSPRLSSCATVPSSMKKTQNNSMANHETTRNMETAIMNLNHALVFPRLRTRCKHNVKQRYTLWKTWHLSLKTAVLAHAVKLLHRQKLLSKIVILRHCPKQHEKHTKPAQWETTRPQETWTAIMNLNHALVFPRLCTRCKHNVKQKYTVWKTWHLSLKTAVLAHAVKLLHRQNYSPRLSSCATVRSSMKKHRTAQWETTNNHKEHGNGNHESQSRFGLPKALHEMQTQWQTKINIMKNLASQFENCSARTCSKLLHRQNYSPTLSSCATAPCLKSKLILTKGNKHCAGSLMNWNEMMYQSCSGWRRLTPLEVARVNHLKDTPNIVLSQNMLYCISFLKQ